MAALIGTYEFDLNRPTPTTGVTNSQTGSAATIWTLVHQLIDKWSAGLTGKWEHVYSSNGYLSGGTHSADPTDNVWWNGGVYAPANLTRGNANGDADKWGAMFAIRAPAGFPGGNRPTLLFTYSRVGGTSTTFESYDWAIYSTNGTITAPATMGYFPTTTGVWVSGISGTAYNWRHAAVGTDTTQRGCHLVLATDGAFFWGANKLGTRRMWVGCACLPMLETIPGDAAPWMIFKGGPSYQDYAHNWPSTTYPSSMSAWGAARFVGCGVVPSSESNTPGAGVQMVRYSGVAASNICACAFVRVAYGNTWSPNTYDLLLTRTAGKDPVRQTWPEYPVWIMDNSGCVRGYPRDLWQSYAQTEFDVSPGGVVPIERMMWGDFWVPSPDLEVPITTY